MPGMTKTLSSTTVPPLRDLGQALQALQVADSTPGRPRSPAVTQATVSPPPPDRPPAAEIASLPRTPSPAKAEPPPDPALEAARRQQERVTTLQAALAPLMAEAKRCVAAARACRTPGPATEPTWARHAREFTAWQAAVQAHDAHAAQVTPEAEALFGPAGPQPDAVRSLRNAVQWCIVSGRDWSSMDAARSEGAVLVEQLG